MKTKTFYKSKSRQNIMNIKNRKLFLRFCNTTLFEKREYHQKNKKFKTIFNPKTLYNQKIIPKINISPTNYPKILQKNSSFPLLNSLSTFQTFQTTSTLKKKQKSSLKKSSSMNYTPHRKTPQIYLTEEELLNKKIIFNSEEESTCTQNFKKEQFSKIFEPDFFPKTSGYIENKPGKDNLDFLLTIQKEVNKFREMKKKKVNMKLNLKELKIKNLNQKDYNAKKLIKKTKKFKFLQFITSLKKDHVKSVDEEFQSKFDSIEERINSIQEHLELFNEKFIKNLANYVKYLDNKRNKEKKNNLMLLKEKIEYKHNIEQINSEIEKMQIKKSQIIKWIFLQIQVKEKKLVLPNYYKKIIESNKAQILLLQGKFYERETNLRQSQKESNKSGSSRKKILLSKKSISSSILKRTIEKKDSKKLINSTYNSKEINSSNKKINIGTNNIKEYITKNEFDKILFWKYSPIFTTYEEFIKSLKELDTQNIYLLQYYNQLQSKIYDYLEELRKIINATDKSDILENQIKEKTNELEKIKNRYKFLYKLNSNLKEEIKTKKRDSKDSTLFPISSNLNSNNSNITKIDMNKIFSKINILFENCKLINNEKFLKIFNYNIKKSNSKESEIIYNLEYVECTIDYLLEKIRYFKRNEIKNELLQKILSDIDKKHKLEKPDKQKREDLEKSIKLLKKLESKNNKVFLKNRRIDYFYHNIKNNKRVDLDEINKNKDDFPSLEEFLRNSNIINDSPSENKNKIRRFSRKKTSKIKKENNH